MIQLSDNQTDVAGQNFLFLQFEQFQSWISHMFAASKCYKL